MNKQKMIVIGAISAVVLLWVGAIAVIYFSIHSGNNGEPAAESATTSYVSSMASNSGDGDSLALPQSQIDSSQTTTEPTGGQQTIPSTTTSTGNSSRPEGGNTSQQGSTSAEDPTIDPATNTSKLEPVDAAPKDNGEEQVTAVYYTESEKMNGFFTLTGKWVCVYVQLDNWSSSKTVTPYDFVLVADGVSYHVSDLNQAGSDPLKSTGVGQNASLQGTLAYEVPADAQHYQLQYISDNGTISFQLN